MSGTMMKTMMGRVILFLAIFASAVHVCHVHAADAKAKKASNPVGMENSEGWIPVYGEDENADMMNKKTNMDDVDGDEVDDTIVRRGPNGQLMYPQQPMTSQPQQMPEFKFDKNGKATVKSGEEFQLPNHKKKVLPLFGWIMKNQKTEKFHNFDGEPMDIKMKGDVLATFVQQDGKLVNVGMHLDQFDKMMKMEEDFSLDDVIQKNSNGEIVLAQCQGKNYVLSGQWYGAGTCGAGTTDYLYGPGAPFTDVSKYNTVTTPMYQAPPMANQAAHMPVNASSTMGDHSASPVRQMYAQNAYNYNNAMGSAYGMSRGVSNAAGAYGNGAYGAVNRAYTSTVGNAYGAGVGAYGQQSRNNYATGMGMNNGVYNNAYNNNQNYNYNGAANQMYNNRASRVATSNRYGY